MAPPRKPQGGAPSSPHDSRPRAQVAYEGEDEFSLMSLDPTRKKKAPVEIEDSNPLGKPLAVIDDLKPKKKNVLGVLKKIFDK